MLRWQKYSNSFTFIILLKNLEKIRVDNIIGIIIEQEVKEINDKIKNRIMSQEKSKLIKKKPTKEVICIILRK